VIVHDGVRFQDLFSARGALDKVWIHGRIQTRSGAIVAVNKWLAAESRFGQWYVRASEYSYHAHLPSIAGSPARDLFRWDNCHGGVETLHRHAFDDQGRATGEIVPIRPEELPPLNLVVRYADELAAFLRSQLT
jgi:hypothetical protein